MSYPFENNNVMPLITSGEESPGIGCTNHWMAEERPTLQRTSPNFFKTSQKLAADSRFYALAAGEPAIVWVRVTLLLRRPTGRLRS
jgi:hypothetical protein